MTANSAIAEPGAGTAGVLLDLGGVVFVGDEALPGAADAVARLRAAGLSVRGLTNTTRTPRRALAAKLARLGVELGEDEIFAPAAAACRWLQENGCTAHLLIDPALAEDFAGLPRHGNEAVVVGDAGEHFTHAAMNAAFRKLAKGAPFLALAKNKSFRTPDGELTLDAGAFVAGLEYACGREALLFGKPARDFFLAAAASMGCTPEACVMIGDDAEADIGGAQAAGIPGILVQSGKYEAGDEDTLSPPPAACVDDLAAAADWLLAKREGE